MDGRRGHCCYFIKCKNRIRVEKEKMRKRKSGLRTIQFYAAVIAENIPSEGMEF